MKFNDLLIDAYGRAQERVHAILEGLAPGELMVRPGGGGNSIAWLIWHLTRVQDDHISDVAGTEQLWTAQGWAARFALDLEVADTGYGHSSAQVDLVRVPSAGLLRDYFDAVHGHTVSYLRGLAEEDLDRIVDTRWDPPVTLGVRLVSVVDDCLEHCGQAAYVKGMVRRGEA
ncbi:mycothiol transferase [Arthrobacter mobilis]|uniref:DinB family protein n=1 Tax=Arthrobacter mobilis TaxID=2724944 RepID=A0A7X6K5Z9_9MICC|nr:DinB family protein [Arthrobacter mobilis]NKX54113.1 DinB family protein [Arthrobacter mobilis]